MSETHHNLTPATIINTLSGLENLVAQLQDQPIIAVDTEANSLYAYQERVCLIQLSYDSVGKGQIDDMVDYIIDPLAIGNMSSFGSLLSNPKLEVVFHGAEYDVMSLKRDFDYRFANLFDTHVAARHLGWQRVGLSSLLDEYYQIKVDKSFQQANWGARPLSTKQLLYAQMDTHYLISLRHMLSQKLHEAGCWEEATEIFEQLTHLPPIEKKFDEEGFWRIKDTRAFNDSQMAVLRELYIWREQMASEINQPPFKVVQDSTLVRLAQQMPTTFHELSQIKGVSKYYLKRMAPTLLNAIQQGMQATPPIPRRSNGIDPDVLARYDALRDWRKNRAAARGVESDVIVSKQVMWALAYEVPSTSHELESIEDLPPYRREKYGEEILKVLKNAGNEVTH